MANEETETMKIKDLFETAPLLTGRTQVESNWKVNDDDFLIDANNILNLKNKTSYWSCSGTAFLEEEAATTIWDRENTEGSMLRDDVSNSIFYLPVNLPHGAIITACQVWGAAGTWSLILTDLSGMATTTVMGTATIDTEDSTIASATIDNSSYGYFIKVVAATSQRIDGARITYTTDYD